MVTAQGSTSVLGVTEGGVPLCAVLMKLFDVVVATWLFCF